MSIVRVVINGKKKTKGKHFEFVLSKWGLLLTNVQIKIALVPIVIKVSRQGSFLFEIFLFVNSN